MIYISNMEQNRRTGYTFHSCASNKNHFVGCSKATELKAGDFYIKCDKEDLNLLHHVTMQHSNCTLSWHVFKVNPVSKRIPGPKQLLVTYSSSGHFSESRERLFLLRNVKHFPYGKILSDNETVAGWRIQIIPAHQKDFF